MPKRPRKKPLAGLARFQDRLLALLWKGGKPEDIRKALLADKKLSEFHDYIKSMEANMLDVSSELVRKWGVKSKRPK